MTKSTSFCQRRLNVALSMALGSVFATSAVAYGPVGDDQIVTVKIHEAVYQQDVCTAGDTSADKGYCKDDRVSEASPVRATRNRAGNALRVIWYGNPKDQDAKKPQLGLLNEGKVLGSLKITGGVGKPTAEDPTGYANEKGFVLTDGQANGADAYSWTSPDNKRDAIFALKTMVNHGDLRGVAELNGGVGANKALVFANATGNGISMYASTDFGEAVKLEGDGSSATGGYVAGGSAISGGSGRARPRSGRSMASTPKIRRARSLAVMSAPAESSSPLRPEPVTGLLSSTNSSSTSSAPAPFEPVSCLIDCNKPKEPNPNDSLRPAPVTGLLTPPTTTTTTTPTTTPSTTRPDPVTATLTPDHNYFGKSVGITVDAIENMGVLMGSIRAVNAAGNGTSEDKRIQYFPTVTLGSGNAAIARTHVWTDDTLAQSGEKTNHLDVKAFSNAGLMKGSAYLASGGEMKSRYRGWNYTRSINSGNALAVSAQTLGSAKHETRASLGALTNTGHMLGNVTQTTPGNESLDEHWYALADSSVYSFHSGNAVEVNAYTQSSTKGTKVTLGMVTNSGLMQGHAELKAGNGAGDVGVRADGVANGVSVYLYNEQAGKNYSSLDTRDKPKEAADVARLEGLNNRGTIKGELVAKPGYIIQTNAAGNGVIEAPEEEVKLLVTTKDWPKSTFDVTRQTPDIDSKLRYQRNPWAADPRPNVVKISNAKLNVYASGNGVSLLAGRKGQGNPAPEMGAIDNAGVISGYSRMYHGYEGDTREDRYARADFLGTGAGIFTNGAFTNTITNTGIISGNHAAILGKGLIDTKYSTSKPDFKTAYAKGSVKNYGLMAGTLIAGNYDPTWSKEADQQAYRLFDSELASDAEQPLMNMGTVVYFKKGLTKPEGFFATTPARHADAEAIDLIKVGAGGTFEKDGQTFTVVNGTLDQSAKDSSTIASKAQYSNTIFNGVGLAKGALVANQDLTLTNSTVNGLVTALALDGDHTTTLTNTVVNTNGFKVRVSTPGKTTVAASPAASSAGDSVSFTLGSLGSVSGVSLTSPTSLTVTSSADNTTAKPGFEERDPMAIRGSEANQTLVLGSNTVINGNVDLVGGNNKVVLADNTVRLNGQSFKLGSGDNTLVLGESVKQEAAPIEIFNKFEGKINHLVVNQPSVIWETARLDNTPKVTELNSTLTYYGDYNLAEDQTLKIGFNPDYSFGQLHVVNGSVNVAGAKMLLSGKAYALKLLETLKPIELIKVEKMEESKLGHTSSEAASRGKRRARRSAPAEAPATSAFGVNGNFGDVSFVEEDGSTSPVEGDSKLFKIAMENGVLKHTLKDDAKLPEALPEGLTKVFKEGSITPAASTVAALLVAASTDAEVNHAVESLSPLMTGSIVPMTHRVIRGMEGQSQPGLWANVQGSTLEQDARGAASGYKATSRALQVGANAELAKVRVGAQVGYAQTKAHTQDFSARHDAKVKTVLVAANGETDFGRVSVGATVGYAYSKVTGERQQVVANQTNVAHSKFALNTAVMGAHVGYAMTLGAVDVKPYVRTDVMLTRQGAYRETGDKTANLDVQAHTTTDWTMDVGAKVDVAANDNLRFGMNAAVGVQLNKPQQDVTASFVGIDDTAFVVHSAEKNRLRAKLQLNAEYNLTRALSLSGGYTGEAAKGFVGHQLGVTLRMKF